MVLFGGALIYGTLRFRYRQLADILKWLAASLIAYVITACIIGPDWKVVAHDTVGPMWPKDHSGWTILVAILGTTISPYIFFWQASQDVEEDKAAGRRMRVFQLTRPPLEIADRAMDVGTGTFFSNLVMYFIILSAALTLHHQGINITTSTQAAAALEPFGGRFATTLFALGILGGGVLAIPALASSAALRLGRDLQLETRARPVGQAREFYRS